MWRERIIGENIALEEILQVKLGTGLDGDPHGRERDGDEETVLRIADGAADEIVCGRAGRSIQ